MPIKHNQYLFQSHNGVWIFQIFVPKYMRHLFGNKRAWRKSTGTRDIVKARHFRNHMLIEFNNIKTLLNPEREDIRIQNALSSLQISLKQASNKSPETTHVSTMIPKLSAIRDEYMTVYSERRAFSTLSKSARAVEVFLQSIKKTDIALDKIGRRLVSEFVDTQQQGGAAPQTVQNWLTSLGSLYEFAKRRYDQIPDSNPFHGHNLEARRTIESYQPFEPHQLQTLIKEAGSEIRDVIIIGLYSGMRLDEIASIKRDEIVTVEGVRCFYVSKSKTKAGVRHIPIHSLLIDIVDKYLSQNSGEYLLPQSNKIKRADGKRGPWYSQAFTRLRRSVLPAATDRQCFHSLRGHFITCLDRAGVPEQRIGAITGHTEQKAKTEAFRTYSKGAGMQELSRHVELVKYDAITC
ncbi:tyrosine-type recombinase/integrase [Escherichia coli]|uniref:tyrosine-type recombinase/integrase n=1 Tax=Escherichia coli TaxID=562 RepID=UPI0019BC284B|nr:tyrosine-type recombinase/integrase [Escherichia coli]ELO4797534.1 tyrosine-type recombinase/integrase [Escherichia coli]ELO5031801.1 tyrosine-type recombinase/integrase [Escherichia coli]MBN6425006.1 tyrosine-type recombinase/integrase [Escherichia coli]MDQ9375490.1 tyrosine-type recombinase/integrase [Escherichia coli]MDQ9460144.1 tyrosine-type recombinase/integrase [Escherichia coli]